MWPTPTPLPPSNVTPQVAIDGEGMFTEVAEQGVQMWQTANSEGLIDTIMFLLILVFVLFALRSISRRLQEL